MSYSTPLDKKKQVPTEKKLKNLQSITIPLDYITRRHQLGITHLDLLFYGFLYRLGLVRLGTDVTKKETLFSQWKIHHTTLNFAKIFHVHERSVRRSLLRLKNAGIVGFEAKIPRQELFLKFEYTVLANITINAEQRNSKQGAISMAESFVLSFISFRSNGKLHKCTQTYRDIGTLLGMSRHTVYTHAKRLAQLGYLIKEAIEKTARTGNTYISAMYHKIATVFSLPKEYETFSDLVNKFFTERGIIRPPQEGT